MDLNTHFLAHYSQQYIASRQSASAYGYGNGSAMASMIGAMAAGVRRAAATIERWARGTDTEVIEYRLPRPSAR